MNDENHDEDRTVLQTDEDKRQLEKDIQSRLFGADSEDDTTINAYQEVGT